MKIALIQKKGQKECITFLMKLVTFLLILFILDLAIGSLLKYVYFKQKYGFYYRLTNVIEVNKADILVFGTSKAKHNFYPALFEKRMNMSCYNVGRDASSIFYHYAVLKAVLKRYSPKIIILDISREFKTKESYDRTTVLLPYYERHPEMRPVLELNSKFEEFKVISKIYPYNSLIISIIGGNLEYNKNRNLVVKGYLPLTKEWKEPIQLSSNPESYELDSTKIKIYESFIKDCLKLKIKLYIVSSPDFLRMKYVEKSTAAGKEIAQKYNVKFFDHSQDTFFLKNARYFNDIMHLNDNGAVVFTNLIINEIESDYLKE